MVTPFSPVKMVGVVGKDFPKRYVSLYQRHGIDLEGLRNVKIDYYDRKEELLKTLENTGFKIYLDRYWQAEVGTMTNHQTGKSTVLNSTNITYKTGLKARDFKPNALERTR